MTEEKKCNPSKGVQSIERALDIIEAVAVEQSGLTLTEISDCVDLHKSTVHRVLSTLIKRNYISKTAEGRYKIGLKPIEVVSYYINNLELQTEARPYVSQITAELGLTAHLGVLDGDKVVYIEKVDTQSAVKLYPQIGQRVYAYCSSLGKCLLSNYSKAQLEDILSGSNFISYTSKTLTTVDALYEEITLIRDQGFAIDDEEYEIGHRCIGAPIYDYRGEIIAAISASGDKYLLTDERIQEVAAYVKKMAFEISKGMGYIG